MRTLILFILALTILEPLSTAQIRERITVKAGTSVVDYFPFNERYLYPEFLNGRIKFKNGKYFNSRLNYDILTSEMVFIQDDDTLGVARVQDVAFIATTEDTFYFDEGYHRIIAGRYPIIMTVRQYVKLVNYSEEGAYGTSNTTSKVDTYNNIYLNSSYKLKLNQDLILSKNSDFYIGNNVKGFVLFKKKNLFKVYSEFKSEITDYLEHNPVDFTVKEDLIRLTHFLKSLQLKMNIQT